MGWFQPSFRRRLFDSIGVWFNWHRLLAQCPAAGKAWRSICWRWRVRAVHAGIFTGGEFCLFRRNGAGFEMKSFEDYHSHLPEWKPCTPEVGKAMQEEFPGVREMCVFSIFRAKMSPKGQDRFRGPIHLIHVDMSNHRIVKVGESAWRS